MKIQNSIRLLILLCAALLGWPLRGAETLAESDARYAAHLEKLDFDATTAAEEWLALHLRRVAAVEQASQRLGDLPGALAAKALQERLRAQGEPGEEVTSPAALATAWKECASERARLRDAEARKRVDLTSKYHAYLSAQASTHTKAGQFVEARRFLQRAQELVSATPPSTARPSALVSPAATPPATPPDIPSLLMAAQPAFWAHQKEWQPLSIDKLEITAGPEGTRLIFPDRNAHAKLVLGKAGLQIGEEWVVEAVGLHALEMVLPAEPWQSLTFKTPDREAPHQFRLTRTADGIVVECDGKPHPGPEGHGLAKHDREAFLAADPRPCLSFYEKNSPRLVRLEHRPIAPRPGSRP